MEGLYVQFHVPIFYPAFFPHEFGDTKAKYTGQYKVHQNNLKQHDRWLHSLGHGLKGHNLSYQTGAAIPDPVALLVMPSSTVETGPKIALEIMAGSQIIGLLHNVA